MAQKFIALAVVVCVLAAFVQSAPQFNTRGQQRFGQFNSFQAQTPAQTPAQAQYRAPTQAPVQQQQYRAQDPERQSRFLVVDDKFHKDPSGEYNFE